TGPGGFALTLGVSACVPAVDRGTDDGRAARSSLGTAIGFAGAAGAAREGELGGIAAGVDASGATSPEVAAGASGVMTAGAARAGVAAAGLGAGPTAGDPIAAWTQ